MIPLKDTVRARRFPLVNTILIGLNILVFLHESWIGPDALHEFLMRWGLVPWQFHHTTGLEKWLPVFTSMFLHGGWVHIISNMLALYIFGDNVEDRMGHWRYLAFYLLSGVIAAIAHVWASADSTMPTVGASGAISGVLGAYLVFYPMARVITLVPIFFWVSIVEIPAVFYLGSWFVSQLFNGLLVLAGSSTFQSGGVAWWAHIGGFVTGLLLAHLFAEKQRRVYLDEYYPW